MKEKLIDLMKEGHKQYYDGSYKGLNVYEPIADHLIANGVTVREQGEWEDYMPYIKYNPNNLITKKRCSVCKSDASPFVTDFCPNCGADMRGEEHEID